MKTIECFSAAVSSDANTVLLALTHGGIARKAEKKKLNVKSMIVLECSVHGNTRGKSSSKIEKQHFLAIKRAIDALFTNGNGQATLKA